MRRLEQKREQLKEYEIMLKAMLADGLVHPLEKSMLRDYAAKNEVSSSSLEHAPHACIHMCILMCMACALHVYTHR